MLLLVMLVVVLIETCGWQQSCRAAQQGGLDCDGGWTWRLIARFKLPVALLQGAHAPLCLGAGAAAGGEVHAAVALPGGLGRTCRGWGWGWGWGWAAAGELLCCLEPLQATPAWSQLALSVALHVAALGCAH